MSTPCERLAAVALAALLVGCAGPGEGGAPPAAPTPPAVLPSESDPSLPDETEIVSTPKTIDEQLEELQRVTSSAEPPLTLGKGDVLSVSVYDEPDLTRDALTVRPDGKIAFPLVGEMQVEGRTVDDITRQLTRELSVYVQQPNVVVVVDEFNSLEYTLFGEVVRPGAYPLVTDVTITEAIAKAGGLTRGAFRASSAELADLTHAFIARKRKVLPVNFVELIRSGDLRFDIALRPGDYIYIPSGLSQEVYIVGEVNKASAFAFREDMPMSRTLALAEGFTADADISRIHIVRGALHNPTVIIADFEAVTEGNAQDVQLEPGDIVYVPPTTLTRWARVIDKLLPLIQTLQIGIILGDAVQ
jgi:polysaccharide export outer membrane protein